MIFYFSGDGDALYAAQYLAKRQNLKIVSVEECIRRHRVIFVPEDGEPVGFIYSVQAWAPPAAFLNFVKKLQLARKNNYIFAIGICSKNSGSANTLLRDTMMNSRIPLNAEFSLVMPGKSTVFTKLASPAKREIILDGAEKKLDQINELILKRRSALDSDKGDFATFKTYLAHPVYKKLFMTTGLFHTDSSCNGCGACVKICPMKNITIKRWKPIWGKKCLYCYACMNLCPKKSIGVGRNAFNHEQYYNPRCTPVERIKDEEEDITY